MADEPETGVDAGTDDASLVETLHRIGGALVAELDYQRLVQIVTDEATQLTGAQFGAFFYNVLNQEGESYMLYTLSGVPREAFSKFPMPRNTQIFDPTFRGVGVVRSDDITQDPRYGKSAPYHGMPKGHLPVRSYLAVAVVSRSGEVLGGLFFGHANVGVFGEREERLASGIASWAAATMDNARLYETAKRARAVAEEALRRAEQANHAKSEFLAMMSHELRTPLNAIGGYVDLMQLELRGPVTDQQREDLGRIQQSQRHLLSLINQVLNYTRVDAGAVRYDLANVRVADAVRAAEALVLPQARARGLRYVVGAIAPALEVHADAEKLQQILLNLLSNAIKFTEPDGEIHVAAEQRLQEVLISVRDTGIGIAPEKLAGIFEPFVQVDQRLTRSHEGVGLGLAISRDLARGMGGDLSVASTVGEGSIFTLTLPRATLEPTQAS